MEKHPRIGLEELQKELEELKALQENDGLFNKYTEVKWRLEQARRLARQGKTIEAAQEALPIKNEIKILKLRHLVLVIKKKSAYRITCSKAEKSLLEHSTKLLEKGDTLLQEGKLKEAEEVLKKFEKLQEKLEGPRLR